MRKMRRVQIGEQKMRRMGNKVGFGLVSGVAALLATAAVAWACTAPVVHQFTVTPDTGDNAVQVPVTVEGSCIANCGLDARHTGLHLQKINNTQPTLWPTDAVRVDQPSACSTSAPVINSVPLAVTEDTVAGAGVVPKNQATGFYYICAGANPKYMWDYYVVV